MLVRGTCLKSFIVEPTDRKQLSSEVSKKFKNGHLKHYTAVILEQTLFDAFTSPGRSYDLFNPGRVPGFFWALKNERSLGASYLPIGVPPAAPDRWQ